jgi:hypothetical protein
MVRSPKLALKLTVEPFCRHRRWCREPVAFAFWHVRTYPWARIRAAGVHVGHDQRSSSWLASSGLG